MDNQQPDKDSPTMLNIILLAKPFEWEVDGTPEACSQHLLNLPEPQSLLRYGFRFHTEVMELDDQSYDFRVSLRANAYAKGIMLAGATKDKTIIRGKVRMGLSILILAIIPILSGVLFSRTIPVYFLLIGLAIIASGIANRNELYNRIHNAFLSDE